MRMCLLNVLEINPASARARQGLAWIEQRYGPAQPSQRRALGKPGSPPASAEPSVELEREIGAPYTRTTMNLSPVPSPRETPPPPAPPAPKRKAPPAPPTQRLSMPAVFDPLAAPLSKPAAISSPSAPASAPPARQPVAKPERNAKAATPALPPTPRSDPTPTTVGVPFELPAAAAPAANLCPYCGAPTSATQKRCTQCRNSLMIRAAPSEKRSPALTILAVLWTIGGALALLATALLLVLFFGGFQALSLAAASSDRPLLGIAFTLVLGLLYITVARGLLARQRWAYYANLALIALSMLGTFALAVAGAALVGLLTLSLGGAPRAGTFALAAIALAGILFALLPLILTLLSYRDFFGPLVRFQGTVEDADHAAHYNNGIAYRDRGMWHMAAREWEAAARKKPRDPNYLHALGLAYARLKQFDRARATLDSALGIAPDNTQIKQSRALIEQMAAK
jgi:hypothetical protein